MYNINDRNRESYNQVAKLFSATRSYLWHDLTPFITYVQDGDKVLDVGCGNGRLLDLLKGIQVKYLGIDFSENLIAAAREKYPAENFQVLDLHNLDSLHERFDSVFCVSVLNHFPPEDQSKIIKNISTMLKPGGYLLMINWNMWNLTRKKSVWMSFFRNPFKLLGRKGRCVWTQWKGGKEEVDLYYYAFSKNHLRKLLTQNGFEVLKNYYARSGRYSSCLLGNNIVTIAQFCSSELERRHSKIHGYGVFAKRRILSGELFYYIPLAKLTYKNYKRFAYIGNGQYVDDPGVLNWVNHSCNPNCRLEINRPDPVLIALRDIAEDEELTCNYDATEQIGVYRKCLCQDGACKGHFGEDKNLRDKLFH